MTTTEVLTEESLFDAPPMGEQERMVEAILFASAEPVTVAELSARMPHGSDPAEALVYLRKRYEGRGVTLVKVGDAWAMRTASDLGFLMQKEVVETRKLSRAAIETLAIIAYHQPATRAEIEEIRSHVSHTFGFLSQIPWGKQFRRVATRYEKTVENLAGFVWLVALIMDILRSFTPLVERMSVDEAYLDVSEMGDRKSVV